MRPVPGPAKYEPPQRIRHNRFFRLKPERFVLKLLLQFGDYGAIRIYFGSIKGVVSFDPKEVEEEQKYQATIQLSEVALYDGEKQAFLAFVVGIDAGVCHSGLFCDLRDRGPVKAFFAENFDGRVQYGLFFLFFVNLYFF